MRQPGASWPAGRIAERPFDALIHPNGAGCGTVSRGPRARHCLGLRVPGGVPAGLPERLAAAKIYVSGRGEFMRITRHLYYSEADTDRLIAELERGA